jgi:4-amino-4-deoxy-L-arabinose transferase-like glycosyltransferase
MSVPDDPGTKTAAQSVPAVAASPPRGGILTRPDALNISLLLVGFACVALLLPPSRPYPVIDDWIYAQSINGLLHGTYRPHDWSATVAFSHNLWGALFASVFGLSFTVLSIANLVMSAACIIVFYLLLRRLFISPATALLGAATLAFNPIYFHLTYSFMTDITFLTFTLLACVFYIRGLRDANGDNLAVNRWIWLGSVMAALACLSRQLGAALLAAVLLYLLLSGRWSWRRAAAAVALPIVALAVYALWERSFGTSLVSLHIENSWAAAFRQPWDFLLERAVRVSIVMYLGGLLLLPLVWRPRKLLVAMPIFLLLALGEVLNIRESATAFPINGNVLDATGFVMVAYAGTPIWTQTVWMFLGLAGALGISFYLAACGERVWRWLRSGAWRASGDADGALLLYLLAAVLTVGLLVLSPFMYDRYFLPVFAVLMVPALRHIDGKVGATGEVRRAMAGLPAWRWVLLAPLAAFCLLAQRDYAEHAAVRWQAAEGLVAQGIPLNKIDGGFEWVGWFLYDEGAERMRRTGDRKYGYFPAFAAMESPEYSFSDVPRKGFKQLGSRSYTSWLEGGRTRQILFIQRETSP